MNGMVDMRSFEFSGLVVSVTSVIMKSIFYAFCQGYKVPLSLSLLIVLNYSVYFKK